MNNTVTRTLSGICFLALVLGGLLFSKYLYAALLALIIVTMMAEFYRMTLGDRYKAARIMAIVLGVSLFGLVFCFFAFGLPVKYAALSAILLLAIMVRSLFEKDRESFRHYGLIYTGLVYIALPLSLSNILVFDRAGNFSGVLMLSLLIIIWASDVGAYCFGLLFGKNGKKLCPTISPKKTWAGFWGGLGSAVVAAIILYLTGMFPFPWWHCIVLAMVMNVMGVFGDLFESQWKRLSDVKDSGHIIPGHGGMLDRFDSAIFAIPAGVIYLIITSLL